MVMGGRGQTGRARALHGGCRCMKNYVAASNAGFGWWRSS